LKRQPQHLIVIGAGYVGLELGQLFGHLDSQVTLTQRSEQLLKNYDPEIGETVQRILVEDGIDVITGATFLHAEQLGNTKRLTMQVQGKVRTLEGDALLVATGRTPNTESLNLAAAVVRTGSHGEILIDDHLRTSNPRIFAAGDVTLGPQYVYVAARQGSVAAENAPGGSWPADLRAVPGVTFTTPAIATVGLTEAQAHKAGYEVKTSVLPLHALPRALVNRDERGVFKVVADARSDEVLGVHVAAENIVGIMGLSLNEHPHRFIVQGVSLTTWCAEDSFFLPALLGQTATVESSSPVSGARINLTIGPRRVETVNPDDAAVSIVVVNPTDANMASVDTIWNTFCRQIHFFASRDEAEHWAAGRDDIEIVDVYQAFELGQQLWSRVLVYAT